MFKKSLVWVGLFAVWPFGASAFDCATNIKSKYMLQDPDSEPEYQAIFNRMKQAEEAKRDAWLEEEATEHIQGSCSINYNTFNYECDAGQKYKDCVDKNCWDISSGMETGLFLENDAMEEFLELKIQQECGNADGDGTSDSAATESSPETSGQDDIVLEKEVIIPKGGNLGTYTVKKQKELDSEKAEEDKTKAQSECNKKDVPTDWEVKKVKGQWQCVQTTESKKRAECAAKTPKMDIKKNAFGKWVCTDSQETKDAEEARKATDKIYKEFKDGLDDFEKAYEKRLKELNKTKGGK